jgi:hypothetical protein
VSSAPIQFRDNWYTLAPPWLQTGNAERYMYTLERCRDLLVEKANEAILFHLPGQGDPSQLPYLAFDRSLVQGPAESNASFVERLQAAFLSWGLAGSARAVLYALQAYAQNLQPGVPAAYPLMAIVSAPRQSGINDDWYTVWQTLYQGTPIGSPPALAQVTPANFNWDGSNLQPWRSWLVLYMSPVATGLSGASAQTGALAASACFTSPGQLSSGVWIPATSGTAVNSPWLTLTGLSGLTASDLNAWITLSGSSHSGNNGTFQIAEVLSSTSCVVVNAAGTANDTGPLSWSIAAYPWLAPAPAWGSPNLVWGQGEATIPPTDTGSNMGGIWQPSASQVSGASPSGSWGLSVSATVVQTIRGLVQQWKSAGTYYPQFIVAFDGGNGTAGNAFSPLSAAGSGNPNGTFGSVGANVAGVWTPTRLVSAAQDCYLQGTGRALGCSVENVT